MGVLRIFTVHMLRARGPLPEADIETSHKHRIYAVHLETQGLAPQGLRQLQDSSDLNHRLVSFKTWICSFPSASSPL